MQEFLPLPFWQKNSRNSQNKMDWKKAANAQPQQNKPYFEAQTDENCLKHAINNMLQDKVITNEELNSSTQEILKHFNAVDIRELEEKSGNWNISVGIKLLEDKGKFVARVSDMREIALWRSDPKFEGLLIWRKKKLSNKKYSKHFMAVSCNSQRKSHYIDSADSSKKCVELNHSFDLVKQTELDRVKDSRFFPFEIE